MAISYADRPHDAGTPSGFRIIRTPEKGTLHGRVASDKMLGVYLHYWRGRSTPCQGADCDACRAGARARWTGYVFLAAMRTPEVAIFEFTERAFTPFDAYYTEHTTLRGALVEASRLSTRPNGPLHVVLRAPAIRDPNLPTPVALQGILEKIWEVRTIPADVTRESVYDQTTVAEVTKGKRR